MTLIVSSEYQAKKLHGCKSFCDFRKHSYKNVVTIHQRDNLYLTICHAVCNQIERQITWWHLANAEERLVLHLGSNNNLKVQKVSTKLKILSRRAFFITILRLILSSNFDTDEHPGLNVLSDYFLVLSEPWCILYNIHKFSSFTYSRYSLFLWKSMWSVMWTWNFVFISQQLWKADQKESV